MNRRLIATFILVVGLTGCASSSHKADPADLAASVKDAVAAKLISQGSTDTIKSMSCIAQSTPREFICHGEMTSGETANTAITVAENGVDWSTHE